MNIYELIQRVQSFYPLEWYIRESVRDFWEVKYNYNSNAIEWTTFTEIETIEVLKWNTIPFHVMREHFEVINHRKAFDFVIELSKTNWEEIFNEKNILKIHELILTNINDEYAGRYRNMNVRISWSIDILPNHLKVPELMETFVNDFLANYKKLDLTSTREILTYGYKLHLDFVKIHPFIDWNGRTSRLLMNMWFLLNFWFIDVIYYKNRVDYIKNIWHSKENINNYFDFMDDNFAEFLDEFLPILEDKIYYKL